MVIQSQLKLAITFQQINIFWSNQVMSYTIRMRRVRKSWFRGSYSWSCHARHHLSVISNEIFNMSIISCMPKSIFFGGNHYHFIAKTWSTARGLSIHVYIALIGTMEVNENFKINFVWKMFIIRWSLKQIFDWMQLIC